MKKIFTIFVFALLLIVPLVVAQEEELPDAGTTPDSALYGLDKAFERMSLAFTFNKEKKAEKHLEYAEERLAELEEMIDEEKSEYSEDLAEEYNNNLEEANEIATTAELLREDKSKLTEIIALATSNHLSVLDRIKDKVPEQAREAITKAKGYSMDGQKNALRILSEDEPEKATEIFSATAEARLNRIKEEAGEEGCDKKCEQECDEKLIIPCIDNCVIGYGCGEDVECIAEAKDKCEGTCHQKIVIGECVSECSRECTQDVKDEIEEFEKLAGFGNEISQIAQGLGKDTTTVDQLVAKATSHHLDVLAEVHAKVPEQARATIERAMSKSVEARETTVTALKNKGALGDISEEVPESVSGKIPEGVRGRIGI